MTKALSLDLVIPDFLPLLRRGAGKTAKRGGCLMQFVSYLWRGEWTDRPECTHEMLAGQAIYVNDSISDAARPALAKNAPKLIGTAYSSFSLNGALNRFIKAERELLHPCCDAAEDPRFGCTFYDRALVRHLDRCITEYTRLRRAEKRHATRVVIEPDTWVGAVSLVGAAAS